MNRLNGRNWGLQGNTTQSRMYRWVQVVKATGMTSLPSRSERCVGTAKPPQQAAVILNF